MRERLAKLIALLTGLLVLLLVMVFAINQNPRGTQYVMASHDTTDKKEQLEHASDVKEKKEKQTIRVAEVKEQDIVNPALIKAGREVFKGQGCARCHSIEGKGNLRNPLDGVGTRRSAKELREFVVGADTLKGVLSDSVLSFKKSYGDIPSDDLNALIIYLQSVK